MCVQVWQILGWVAGRWGHVMFHKPNQLETDRTRLASILNGLSESDAGPEEQATNEVSPGEPPLRSVPITWLKQREARDRLHHGLNLELTIYQRAGRG